MSQREQQLLADIRTLQTENAKLRGSGSLDEVARLQHDIIDLRKQLAACGLRCDALQSELTKKTKKASDLEQERDAALEALSAEKSYYAAALMELKEARQYGDDKSADLDSANAVVARQRAEIASLKSAEPKERIVQVEKVVEKERVVYKDRPEARARIAELEATVSLLERQIEAGVDD